MSEVHFALAFPTVGWSDPDSITFMVMQSLLGSWDRTSGAGETSILTSAFSALIAKRGLMTPITKLHHLSGLILAVTNSE